MVLEKSGGGGEVMVGDGTRRQMGVKGGTEPGRCGLIGTQPTSQGTQPIHTISERLRIGRQPSGMQGNPISHQDSITS